MKRSFRYAAAALLLAATLPLAGCDLTVEGVMSVIAPETTPVPGSGLTFQGVSTGEAEPLELTYKDMDGSFCPFWASTDGDRLVASLTQFPLRPPQGATDGTEIAREENEDGSTTVTIRLPEGVVGSDGYPLGADDLIFSYYVLFDSNYDGPYTLKTLPVRGLSSYWNGMDSDMYSKYVFLYDDTYRQGRYDQDLQSDLEKAKQEALGRGVGEGDLASDAAVRQAQEAVDAYDAQRADEIRSAIEAAWRADADNLIEYVMTNYSATIAMGTEYSLEEIQASEGLRVMAVMRERLYGVLSEEDGSFTATKSGKRWDLTTEFPTVDDLYHEMVETYNGDAEQYWSIEGIGRPNMLDMVENQLVRQWAAEDAEWRGAVDSIQGVEKVDERTVRVTLEYCDDGIFDTLTDIYLVPLHIYGNADLFDPANGLFGFPRRDIRPVRLNSSIAIGGGEYVYRETDIRTVYLDPNGTYFYGAPAVPYAVITKEP